MDALVSKISLSPPVTGHQSLVIHCQHHQAPVTGHPGMDKITGHFLPVTGHPVTSHPGNDKITGHLSRVLVSGHCDGLLVTPTGHQLRLLVSGHCVELLVTSLGNSYEY